MFWFCGFVAVAGTVQHGSQYKCEVLYEHTLQRTAYKLCSGPFGGVKGKYSFHLMNIRIQKLWNWCDEIQNLFSGTSYLLSCIFIHFFFLFHSAFIAFLFSLPIYIWPTFVRCYGKYNDHRYITWLVIFMFIFDIDEWNDLCLLTLLYIAAFTPHQITLCIANVDILKKAAHISYDNMKLMQPTFHELCMCMIKSPISVKWQDIPFKKFLIP